MTSVLSRTIFVCFAHNEKSHMKEPLSARREFFFPTITLERTSTVPLRRQIYRQIARDIHSGAIPPGARLPSTRLLARLLRVSRNTCLAAYDELAGDNLARGERGSGMRVLGRIDPCDLSLFTLRRAIRASRYPARILPLADLDGNPLYFNF
jgi:hypothetical protein